jgi:hypothetical protein
MNLAYNFNVYKLKKIPDKSRRQPKISAIMIGPDKSAF